MHQIAGSQVFKEHALRERVLTTHFCASRIYAQTASVLGAQVNVRSPKSTQ